MKYFLLVSLLLIASCKSTAQPSVLPPVVEVFHADAITVKFGTGTSLSWRVLDKNAQVRIDPAPGNVGTVGTAFVTPFSTTTYTLTARNEFGTSQRTLIIQVVP